MPHLEPDADVDATPDATDLHATEPNPPGGRPGGRRLRACLVLALAVAWAAHAVDGALPVEVGEPWALRWTRSAARHPERLALAVALFTWGVATALRSEVTGTSD